MARLTGLSTQAVGEDRVGVAVRSAQGWDKVVVLKGAFTVVAFPSGRAMLSPFANPGLASAGTGDVLAGAIAGLLSQGMPLEDAATLGVYLHGLAGDLATAEMGTTGMLAGDLLSALPKAMKGD
jgi:NAD(P)H-hydrate epimerase